MTAELPALRPRLIAREISSISVKGIHKHEEVLPKVTGCERNMSMV